MKKLLFVWIFLVGMVNIGFSQGTFVYTFFLNIVSEEFHFPLVGFVNIAKGDHTFPHIGFVNWNTGNFSSLQMGFVNTVGSNLTGAQIGFMNTVANDTKGFQFGFVNTSVGDTKGFQFGFVNASVGNTIGSQFGFLNTTAKDGEGLHFGFINSSTQKLKGIQIGFINHTDSIENGIPIGFISIVRHGGYQAVEYNFSEFYPLNIEFKIGAERFYTNFIVAYNSFEELDPKKIAIGLGIGSILPISDYFFINPELNGLTSLFSDKDNQLLSFTPFLGFNLNKNFSITVGPSITWLHSFNYVELQKTNLNRKFTVTPPIPWSQSYNNIELKEPIFKITENIIDKNNSIILGARFGVRFRF
jgi:hypothetical protein